MLWHRAVVEIEVISMRTRLILAAFAAAGLAASLLTPSAALASSPKAARNYR
jgi:hypothetical protein